MRVVTRLGVVVGLVLAGAGAVLAQQPRPGAKPAEPAAAAPAAAPTLVMSASVASLEKVAALAKDAGVGEVPYLSATFVEQQMPFIGTGGLAADRPLGILLYAGGERVDLEEAAIVLPVNPGKADLASFVKSGAKPFEGRGDMVTLEGMGFRRGKDQFIFGQMPPAVAAVPEDALARGYVGNELVARVDVDVAVLKRAIPKQYEQFFAELDAGVDADDPAARAGADLVIRPMRGVTRLGLSLARAAAGGLRLGVSAEPFDLPDAPAADAAFPRPGFPEGTVFRADFVCAPARALAAVAPIARLLEREAFFADATPEQQDQFRRLAADVADLLLAGNAGSLGVELIDGKPVVYWITRHPAGGDGRFPDLGADMRAIAVRAEALSKSPGADAKPKISLQDYSVGEGERAHRLVLLDEAGAPELYLDTLQREGLRFVAIAAEDTKPLERVLALKPEGNATALASGWIDLSMLAKADMLPDADDAGLGETAMKELKAGLAGQRLDWTLSGAKGTARIDLDFPPAVLQTLGKATGLVQ